MTTYRIYTIHGGDAYRDYEARIYDLFNIYMVVYVSSPRVKSLFDKPQKIVQKFVNYDMAKKCADVFARTGSNRERTRMGKPKWPTQSKSGSRTKPNT